MISLKTPIKKEDVLSLKVGDEVSLNGTVFTARDKAHQYLVNNEFEKIRKSVIYHCGPIIKDNSVISAGPTTSGRMDIYTNSLIDKYEIRVIIGKGGMQAGAFKGKAVYLSAVGGAGVFYANKMKVKSVFKKEFGMPDAIWEFEVRDFPTIVSIDSRGNSLYEKVYDESKTEFLKLIK